MSGYDERAVRATWQCASWLLDYPGELTDALVGDLYTAIADLPPKLGEPLARFLAHRAGTDPWDLEADYVATFDARRRCSLFLTYFAHGDTRKRGLALLRFKQAYRAAGVELADTELPDHLSVVLEFGATVDLSVARGLLTDHRAGLETLRHSLHDLHSPWADVLEAVSRTLPPLRGDERDAVRRLAAEGPPEEEVGLVPYGTVDLPFPAVPAAGQSLTNGAGR